MSSPPFAASPTRPNPPQRRTLQSIGRLIVHVGEHSLRDFPWRSTRDPWHILIAEVALQQTQAARVAERFAELTHAMVTPVATVELGKAGVVGLWSGLGYNARAVRLFHAAEHIVERFHGAVPTTNEELRTLPGVGAYTAAAVEAFAFERDVAVYDTNVARVIARAVLGAPTTASAGWQIAAAMVPKGSGWVYNQAMLDFGATRCTARSPRCHDCPLRRRCAWKQLGAVEDPARTTAGTARPQGRFEGSTRQARGRIIERLRLGPATFEEFSTVTGWENREALSTLIDALKVAGLVAEHRGKYRLSE